MTELERQQNFFDKQLQSAFFAEDVVYNAVSGPIPCKAIIYRNTDKFQSLRSKNSGSTEIKYDIEIRVGTKYVPLITEKKESVTLQLKRGATPITLSVATIIDSDLASWRLGLKA